MKSYLLPVLVLTSLLYFSSCHKLDIASGTPSCIRNEIKDHKNDPQWMIGSVDEYLFRDKTVYAFSPDNNIIADGSTEVKDVSCNTLCHVGGFGGPSINICNGENFFQNAQLVKNIWKK
jgi:hypothetical protein